MYKQRNKKLSGGALVLTVVISLLIYLLCICVILIGYFNRELQQIWRIDQRMQSELHSMLNLVLADTTTFYSGAISCPDLEEGDSIQIKTSLWGLYQVASLSIGNEKFHKRLLMEYGTTLPDTLKACLYLAEHQRPLSLVGKTKLIGDVYVPAQGVRPGFAEQRSFDLAELFEGKVHKSTSRIPLLDDQLTDYLDTLITSSALHDYNYLPDSLNRSFYDATTRCFIHGPVSIGPRKFSGHVLIQSDSTVEISKESQLNNVVIVAPVIIVQTGFRGVAQLFATQIIQMEEGSMLDYPSSMVLLKQKKSNSQPQIYIGKECRVNGVILSIAKDDDLYKTKVETNQNTQITGVVLVCGYLSCRGTIDGIVLTDYFIYKGTSTTYENLLMDAQINRRKLPNYFVSTSFFNKGTSKSVIQWLD